MFCCGRVAMNDGGKDTGGMAGEGWFRTSRDGATLVFAVGGRWTLATAAGLDEKLGQVTTAGVRQGRLPLSAGERPRTARAPGLFSAPPPGADRQAPRPATRRRPPQPAPPP